MKKSCLCSLKINPILSRQGSSHLEIMHRLEDIPHHQLLKTSLCLHSALAVTQPLADLIVSSLCTIPKQQASLCFFILLGLIVTMLHNFPLFSPLNALPSGSPCSKSASQDDVDLLEPRLLDFPRRCVAVEVCCQNFSETRDWIETQAHSSANGLLVCSWCC